MYLGIDLGTTGVRVAVIDEKKDLIYSDEIEYPTGLEVVEEWENCSTSLIRDIPKSIKNNLIACSVDGTSGTIIACDYKGKPLGNALPYHLNCPEQKDLLKKLIPQKESVGNSNSSLARALRLINLYGANILLRHQADWINGWLINNWRFGEENNNYRLGWNAVEQCWPKRYTNLQWKKALPKIVKSGSLLGKIASKHVFKLSLPKEMILIAGTTDANAAVLAANANSVDGITILGSTIVVKAFVKSPLKGIGITNHKVAGRWITGGASNAGGAVLRKFFSNQQLLELSRQINPEFDSGINLLPLPFEGERFPVNDPTLKPVLEPRPISDSLYLHALLEGLTKIEVASWKKLQEMGAAPPKKIITLGGGARNPQWRRLRERALNIPVKTCSNPPAYGAALLAMDAIKKNYFKTI